MQVQGKRKKTSNHAKAQWPLSKNRKVKFNDYCEARLLVRMNPLGQGKRFLHSQVKNYMMIVTFQIYIP